MYSNPVERRKYPRQFCGLDHPLIAYVGSNRLPVHVRDISLGGVGLVLTHRPSQGASLPVKLAMQGTYMVRYLRVLHVTELAPRCCIVGGSFEPQLKPEELQSVLTQQPR
jgi:hypothetical protein